MSTRYARIGLTRDPELEAALQVTRGLLAPAVTRSQAGHVRELALLGARALAQGSVQSRAAVERQRLLERPGVRPATEGLDDLPWLDADRVDEERSMSAALEWARGLR